MDFKQLLSTKLHEALANSDNDEYVTINKPGHSLHGKDARVFYKHPDGRINAQVGSGKNIKANLTLNPGEFNKKETNEGEMSEAWDFESELKAAGQYADKKLKNKSKASIDADDSWTGSKHTQVTDKSFADKKPVGRRISGTYGTSYDPAADEEKPTKTTDSIPKKRGRPTGALGAAKKGLNTYNAKDAGRNLAQILGIKLDRKLMGKKPTTKHKLSDIDTSGIKTESTDNSLSEMTMGSVKTAAGKKVEWINHPGLCHSVSVNGVPAHTGFLDQKSAAHLYAKHIAE